jgi:hypothetical protein
VLAWIAVTWAAEAVRVPVEGGAIEVIVPESFAGAPREELILAVAEAGRAVALWYGRFPVRQLRIEVTPAPGIGIRGATTWPGSPPRVTMTVGSDTSRADYRADWVLVHELTHLAFPAVADRHHWIEEGLATYLEPWERVAAGTLSPEAAWHDFVRDLPQALPMPAGLDRTGTWASTYWGGALYCLLVDLEIRERTDNRLGLRDAVRAIAARGGMDSGGIRELAEVLAMGDAAVGTPVLTETWRRLAASPVVVDLDALWAELGVRRVGGTVIFDDAAPRAAIRRAIAPVPDQGPIGR